MKRITGKYYADSEGQMRNGDASRLKTYVRLGVGDWWGVEELRNMLVHKYGADHVSDMTMDGNKEQFVVSDYVASLEELPPHK